VPSPADISRRALCAWLGAALWPSLARAQSVADHGRVEPPTPVPDIGVVRHDGTSSRLRALVRDRATAVQIMFTSCRAACPIEGAIFERVQMLVPDQLARGIQLLSLSIDPRNDTPLALSQWLSRFHARPGWIAAAPRLAEVEHLRAFAGAGRNPADNHSTQVHLVDRRGLLVWRTFELPEAEEIAGILRKL
jgi:protein SCO1/2